jgi:hypothetical protein
MPFWKKNYKTNWNYLLVVFILAVIFSVWMLYSAKKQETLFLQFPEIKKVTGNKEEQQKEVKEKELGEKESIARLIEVQSLLVSLISDIKKATENTNKGNVSLVPEFLENYEEKFSNFNLKISQLEIEKISDKNLITNLRKSEWENYKSFLDLKKSLTNYPQFSQKVTEIENLIEDNLKNQILKAVKTLTIKNKVSSSFKSPFLAGIIKIFLAQTTPSQKVIHKRVSSGESWKYESWIELETGNIRQEIRIKTAREIISEIDITDGKTGKKLALNPDKKLAEWLDPKKGKIGIGDEQTKDPFTIFQTDLEEGKCHLEGADIFENKEVYVIECPFYEREYFKIKGECVVESKEFGKKCIGQGEICKEEVLDPNKEIYTLKCPDYEIVGEPTEQWGHYNTKEYKLFYIDVQTYFPIKELIYEEHLYLEERVPNEFKLYKTLNFSYQYEGEIIDRELLPPDFFELKIPDGYELKEWVGYE